MPGTEEQVIAEFHAFLNDAAGTYTYALTGLHMLRQHVVNGLQWSGVHPATPLEASTGPLPCKPDGEIFQAWSHQAVLDNLDERGLAPQQIGHQWLTQVYHRWDDKHYGFRARIATARGLGDKSQVKDPLMGDLRRMRNDVVHHRGIATAENTGKCERLRWFNAGEGMFIERRMVHEVMGAFGLTIAASTGPYLSFPSP